LLIIASSALDLLGIWLEPPSGGKPGSETTDKNFKGKRTKSVGIIDFAALMM